MKKRFLCAVLGAVLCLSQVMPVMADQQAAETAEKQEVATEAAPEEAESQAADEAQDKEEAAAPESEEAAEDKEEAAASQEQAKESDTAAEDEKAEDAEEELDAQENESISIVDMPKSFSYGKETHVTILVAENTDVNYRIYRASDSPENFIFQERLKGKPAEDEMSDAKISVPLNFANGNYTVGKYVLMIWEASKGNDTSDAVTKEFKILRSINPEDWKGQKEVPVSDAKLDPASVVYTGNDVEPKFTITDKINGQTDTLVQGRDFRVEFVSGANKKEIGSTKVKISGISDNDQYTGSVIKEIQIQPRNPKLPTAKCISNKSIELTWDKVPEATGYSVRRKADNGEFYQIYDAQGNTNISYADDKELVPGNEYEYQIIAYAPDKADSSKTVFSSGYTDANGKKYGTKVMLTTAAPKIESAVNVKPTKIKLTWTKVEGAKGYNVYQIKKDGSLKLIKDKLKKNNYNVGKLKCGTDYKFIVKAYIMSSDDKNMIESAASAAKSIKARPAAPKMVEVKSIAANKISLKWRRVDSVTGYIVYRKPTGEDADWKKIKEIKGAKNVTFTDDKAKTGVKYAYTVASYKKVKGKKVKSLMDAKGSKVLAACEGPTVTTEQRRADKANIYIKNVTGADGYILYRKAGDGKFSQIAKIKRQDGEYTIYADMKVTVGTTYTYYAIGYSETDDKTVKGAKGPEATLVMKNLTVKK